MTFKYLEASLFLPTEALLFVLITTTMSAHSEKKNGGEDGDHSFKSSGFATRALHVGQEGL